MFFGIHNFISKFITNINIILKFYTNFVISLLFLYEKLILNHTVFKLFRLFLELLPLTKVIIKATGCYLLYLSTYSPDLNPFEHWGANFKNYLQKIINKWESFSLAITRTTTKIFSDQLLKCQNMILFREFVIEFLVQATLLQDLIATEKFCILYQNNMLLDNQFLIL